MTHAKTYSSSLEFDIIGNLEEFGLSKYEARAYITLVEKGTLGASEIAYYSHSPRTKIYTTLKKGPFHNHRAEAANCFCSPPRRGIHGDYETA